MTPLVEISIPRKQQPKPSYTGLLTPLCCLMVLLLQQAEDVLLRRISLCQHRGGRLVKYLQLGQLCCF